MPSEAEILDAARILAREARSATKVILFGSYARGEAGPGSDLDFLVIEEAENGRIAESARLRRALPDLGVPVDVVVMGAERFEYWRETYGTLAHSAASEGRLLASA